MNRHKLRREAPGLMIEMMFIVLILIAAVLVLVMRSRKSRKASDTKEGGVVQKYAELLQLLKAEGKIEAERITTKSVSFRIRGRMDTNNYVLTEVDGRMIAVWTLESSIHGRRGKEWSFAANYDQLKMFEEIANDLKQYQLSLHREAK